MNYKHVILLIAAVGMIGVAGCAEWEDDGNENAGDDLADDTGADTEKPGESYWYEIGITESNQQNLVRERPPFQMEDSLERQNLIERYKHLNDRENEHHVYLMSNDGKVISYFVAQGKVSSVNSKLTNDEQIVRAKDCSFDGGNGAGGAEGSCFKTVESPQMDGSYGENGDAIFFFTTSGEYVEWNGKYLVSEEPKNIQTAVSLVDVDDEDGNSVGNNSSAQVAG